MPRQSETLPAPATSVQRGTFACQAPLTPVRAQPARTTTCPGKWMKRPGAGRAPLALLAHSRPPWCLPVLVTLGTRAPAATRQPQCFAQQGTFVAAQTWRRSRARPERGRSRKAKPRVTRAPLATTATEAHQNLRRVPLDTCVRRPHLQPTTCRALSAPGATSPCWRQRQSVNRVCLGFSAAQPAWWSLSRCAAPATTAPQEQHCRSLTGPTLLGDRVTAALCALLVHACPTRPATAPTLTPGGRAGRARTAHPAAPWSWGARRASSIRHKAHPSACRALPAGRAPGTTRRRFRAHWVTFVRKAPCWGKRAWRGRTGSSPLWLRRTRAPRAPPACTASVAT